MSTNINPILYYSTSGLVSSSGFSVIQSSQNTGNSSDSNNNINSTKKLTINIAPFSLLPDYKIIDNFGNITTQPTFSNPKYIPLTNKINEFDFCVTLKCVTSQETFYVNNYANIKIVELGNTFELIKNEQKFTYQESVNPNLIKILKSILHVEISGANLLVGVKYIKNTNYPRSFPNITTFNYINSLFGFMYTCGYNDNLTISVESIS